MERAHEVSEAEGVPQYSHPELQATSADSRDYGVDQWYHRKNKLSEYDPQELEAVVRELHEIPEVESHANERVKLENILAMTEVATDYVADGREERFVEATAGYSDLTDQLTMYVDRYTDTVRRFQTVQLQRFHLETEKYQTMMKNVDQSRRTSHDALMAHLKAVSRYLTVQIPKHAGSGFNAIGWEEQIKRHWFTIDELHDRNAITDWAIRADIVRKATDLEQAITQVLEQKKMGTEQE